MSVSWIKLSTDIFVKNSKMQHICQQKNGKEMALFWIALLTAAGECNDGGMIYITPKVPYTPQGLAERYHFTSSVVKRAIPLFCELDMLENTNGFLCVLNWDEYQSEEGLSKVREQNRLRKQAQRERAKAFAENAEQDRDVSRDMSRDSHKEEKSNKKEEKAELEREEDKEIYSADSSARVRACACACESPPPTKNIEDTVTSLFTEYYARYPTNADISQIAGMIAKRKEDVLTEDELYLLTVAFKSSVNANVREVRYLQGCFRKFKNRGISTKAQYDEAFEKLQAKKAELNQKPKEDPPSYGDSQAFFEAAVKAGMED